MCTGELSLRKALIIKLIINYFSPPPCERTRWIWKWVRVWMTWQVGVFVSMCASAVHVAQFHDVTMSQNHECFVVQVFVSFMSSCNCCIFLLSRRWRCFSTRRVEAVVKVMKVHVLLIAISLIYTKLYCLTFAHIQCVVAPSIDQIHGSLRH